MAGLFLLGNTYWPSSGIEVQKLF